MRSFYPETSRPDSTCGHRECGGFSKPHTKEVKEKISNSLLGNKNNLGKKASEETKTKMSKIHTGINNSRCKVTEAEVLEIRNLHQQLKQSKTRNIFQLLSRKYNLSVGALEKLIYRQNWKHIL